MDSGILYFILFIICTFSFGFLWGSLVIRVLTGYQIKHGKLPGILPSKQYDDLLDLLMDKKLTGGVYPKASGSEPGLELKAK